SARVLSGVALARRELLNFLFFFFFDRRGGRRGPRDERLVADLGLDLACELRVFLEEIARVVLALAEAVAVVDVPGARLLEHGEVDADLEHLAFARDAVAVHD